jgi:lipid-A-disaccharide synthase
VAEVFSRLPAILRALRDASRHLRESPPDIFVPIDFPDFNLRLASVARKAGVRVAYYVSPQIWAWRPGRIRVLARVVDRMIVIFPFEAPLYERAGVPVEYVGHPLLDVVRPTCGAEEFLADVGISGRRPRLGVLSGSRPHEVERLLGPMLGAARWMRERGGELDVLVSESESLPEDFVRRRAESSGVSATVVRGRTYDLINACDFVLVASGTATLEVALLERPMVILYKVAPLSWLVARSLVKVRDIGLVNIAAGRQVVPELLQGEVQPARIGAIARAYLADPLLMESVRKDLAGVRRRLGEGGAARRAAEVVLRTLAEGRGTGAAPARGR